MNSVCVFCGSRHGGKPAYSSIAKKLAVELVKSNLSLVYGGGKVGLMGEIADAVLAEGGKAVGVIPEFLYHEEVAHEGLTELLVVSSMHERKQMMSELADAFIAMPGGFGTLEELAEIITWKQLDLVPKPIGILNTEGYFNNLFKFFDTSVEEGFVDLKFRNSIISESDPKILVSRIQKTITIRSKEDLDKT